MDTESRTYFRNQTNLIKKISALFEKMYINNEWFDKIFHDMKFFQQLLKRIEDRENSCKRTLKKRKQISKIIKKSENKQQASSIKMIA